MEESRTISLPFAVSAASFGFLAACVGFAAASAAGAGPVLLSQISRQKLVIGVAAASAVAAAGLSSASATGTPLLDGAYRGVVVGLATYLGSRLRLPVLAVVAVATAALSAGHALAGLGAVAAVGALVGWRGVGRSSGSGRAGGPAAVTAGFCALSVLQPGATMPLGFSAVGSAAVLLALCILGYRKAPGDVRRRVGLVVLGGSGVLGLAAALSVAALAEARPSLEVGVASATRGAQQARALDSPAAARSMQSAAGTFERANARVRSPVGRAGLVVPLLSQHVRAIDGASASGAELGRAAAGLAEAVDQDALRISGGRVPLEQLQDAQPKAARAAAAIGSARGKLGRQRSPWLLPQLTSRLDRVEGQLATAGDQADRAAAVLAEIPPLLGSEGPRRYFVAVQTPSELRGSGGFMGSFVEIAVDDGRLTLARSGRTSELNADRSTRVRTLDAPDDFQRRYAQFAIATTWQSVTISPHFPSDAQVIRSLYPQSGGRPVDAVFAIDPFAIQAILQVVGPVRVPGSDTPLTGENAAKVLLFDQYRTFGDNEQDDRRDFLAGATQALAERLLSGPVSLRPLARALGPMVEEKHLLASAGAAAEEPAFARLGLTGAMAALRGDSLAVVAQNASPSKIDWFLRRKVDYAATVDPRSGALTARATVQLSNQAPPSGLPRYLIGNSVGLPSGTSRLYVSIFSPLQLQGATIDGRLLRLDPGAERDRAVYSAFVDVPAGATVTLALDLAGALPPDRPYRLDIHRQPSVAADELTLSLDRVGSSGSPTRREISQTKDTVFEVPFPG